MILVSGGTGLVGSEIVKELLRRGEKVGVLGRDAGKIESRYGTSVVAREADVRDPKALAEAMAGVHTVVNTVQFPTSPIEIPRRGWTFEQVDWEGTRNQVDAARAAGVKRFVSLSGVGADPAAKETWFRAKGKAEQYLIDSGLEPVILRPTWVYGPNDISLNRILGFAKYLPFIPLFGDGKNAMQPLFFEDLGRIGAGAATRPEAAGKLMEVGGPEVMTFNEVIKTALDVMGKRRPILHQPIFVGKVAGTLASVLPNPPLSADAVEFITQPAVADNTVLMETLAPELTPFRAGVETYMRKR